MKRSVLLLVLGVFCLALAGCGGDTSATATATPIALSTATNPTVTTVESVPVGTPVTIESVSATVDVSAMVEASVVARLTAQADADATAINEAYAQGPNVSANDTQWAPGSLNAIIAEGESRRPTMTDPQIQAYIKPFEGKRVEQSVGWVRDVRERGLFTNENRPEITLSILTPPHPPGQEELAYLYMELKEDDLLKFSRGQKITYSGIIKDLDVSSLMGGGVYWTVKLEDAEYALAEE